MFNSEVIGGFSSPWCVLCDMCFSNPDLYLYLKNSHTECRVDKMVKVKLM